MKLIKHVIIILIFLMLVILLGSGYIYQNQLETIQIEVTGDIHQPVYAEFIVDGAVLKRSTELPATFVFETNQIQYKISSECEDSFVSASVKHKGLTIQSIQAKGITGEVKFHSVFPYFITQKSHSSSCSSLTMDEINVLLGIENI